MDGNEGKGRNCRYFQEEAKLESTRKKGSEVTKFYLRGLMGLPRVLLDLFAFLSAFFKLLVVFFFFFFSQLGPY